MRDLAALDALPKRFADALRARHGPNVAAVVLYGSWLRGKRDTVLDFYLLLDDYSALSHFGERILNRLLAPNVYNIVLDDKPERHSAKYATISLRHFEQAIANDFHSYFWARFAQPIAIVYARTSDTQTRIDKACELAAQRMLLETIPLMTSPFTMTALWQRAFTLTYGCELRSEDPSKSTELVASYAGHLDAMTCAVAKQCGLEQCANGAWRTQLGTRAGRMPQWRWRIRRWYGKLLSVLRLFKAAFTFNDPLDYVLWKVARHSGVVELPTALQQRHPLIFAWPLLWRIYRRGGFR